MTEFDSAVDGEFIDQEDEGEVDPFHIPEGELIEDVNPVHEKKQRRRKVKEAAAEESERVTTAKTIFGQADAAEEVREQNRLIGLLIGPKNLEKLRAFGYDVLKVKEGALTPSVAHRGMTE